MSDLISRQAAIAKFEPWLKVEGYSEGELNMLKAVLYELTVMPSAEPERPKGQWVIYENQRQEDIENGNYMYVCTNCLHSDVHAKTVTVPFCWYCGAEMRGERNDYLRIPGNGKVNDGKIFSVGRFGKYPI